MKSPLKPLTKYPNRHTQIVSPLLTLVVVTLMSATAVQANAELIVHSDTNQKRSHQHPITSVRSMIHRVSTARYLPISLLLN